MKHPRRILPFVVAALLCARVLGIISVYFFEEDEVALAVGAAALVADTPGNLYRYTVQAGYYRLVEMLDLMIGGRIDLIPAIMKGLSAVAGALIPAIGFFAFKNVLTERERWLAVFALTVNPIIWQSSRYGNTALLATMLATAGLVLLSTQPARRGRVLALALVGAAIVVRADCVLVLPVAFALLHRIDRSWRTSAIWAATFGLAMALVYGGIVAVDPRADSAVQSVSSHMNIGQPSLFWEYLLWAISPCAAAFAILGMRTLLDSRQGLVGLLLLWGLPSLLFYFRATTTARYFLIAAVPLSIAAAVGMSDLVDRLQRRLRARMAWAVVLGAASVHLLVALGHVPPDRPAEMLYGGTFNTHDGPMPTGALLARTYLTPGSLLRALPNPRFGAQSYPFWEGVSFNQAMAALADPTAPSRTVIVVLSGGFGHAFHYHTHAAGARFFSGLPKRELLWAGAIWFTLGNSRVMTIAGWSDDYGVLPRFEVVAGDQVWSLGATFPDKVDLAKMPPGLRLSSIPSFDPHFQTFEVISR